MKDGTSSDSATAPAAPGQVSNHASTDKATIDVEAKHKS